METPKTIHDMTTTAGRRAACGYAVRMDTCSFCLWCDKVRSFCTVHEFGVNQDRGKCNDYAERF